MRKNRLRNTPPYETLSDIAMGALGVIVILVVVIIILSSSAQTAGNFEKIKQANQKHHSALATDKKNLDDYKNSDHLKKELERLQEEYKKSQETLTRQIAELESKEKALKEQEKRLEQIKKISELLKKDKQYYSELQLEVKALENELKYLIGDKKGSSYERGGTAHLIYGTWKGSENNGWQELVLIGDRGIFSKQEMLIITNAIKAPEGKDGYASFFWRWDNENSDYKQDAYSGTVREWLSENGPWGPVKTRTK